jgi:hypothetical protein
MFPANPAFAFSVATLCVVGSWLTPSPARAHCDGLDGPVVTAARAALERGDVNRVLVWVQPSDEKEIRAAFDRTRAVRRLAAPARELADQYFFETLVRLHRAGEGAPYTGLKPAGRDLGPAIPAADRALESADPEPLVRLLVEAARAGVLERFKEATSLKPRDAADVARGREYVRAYVEFIHYVERLHAAAVGPVEGHAAEAE